MVKQVQKTTKEIRQQKKLGQMIKNLATMIEDTTKPFWKSKTVWVGAATVAASIVLYFAEGAEKGTMLATIAGIAAIVLRLVTNKGVR